MKPWWASIPGRREYELEELVAAGANIHNVDDSTGILVVDFDFPCHDQLFELRAIFPSEYPRFRPDVYSRGAHYQSHYNPITRGLCLLAQSTQQWQPMDTLARLLTRQLPEFTRLQAPDAAPAPDADQQAEPAIPYFPYDGLGGIAFDTSIWIPPRVTRGTFNIRGRWLRTNKETGLQGVVTKVIHFGEVFGTWPHPFTGNLFTIEMVGKFVRTGKPEFIADPKAQLEALGILHRSLQDPTWMQIEGTEKEIALSAILFDDDIGAGKRLPTWMFFLLERAKGSQTHTVKRIRPIRAGETDFGARVPSIRSLRDKTVLLVGCGAIGAPIALDLARNGVRTLRLIDGDHAEMGPSVRWPLGLSAVGVLKSISLAMAIIDNYPATKTEAIAGRIGSALDPERLNKKTIQTWQQALGSAFQRLDLLIDATAEIGVQNYLSAWARQNGVPYIYASATPGALGGQVGRFMPGSEQGCWTCAQHAMHTSGKLEQPPFLDGPAGEVLPAGCQHATFVGASYDLHEVSLQAMRMAVQALSGPCESGFARLAYEGDFGLPKWTAHAVPRDPTCPECR